MRQDFNTLNYNRKAYGITLFVLTLLLFSIFWLGNYPEWIETYYAEGLYPAINAVRNFLIGWLPISLGDLLYLALIAYLVYSVVRFVRLLINKSFNHIPLSIMRLIIGFQIFACAFYLLWGLNYFRPPAAVLLQLPQQEYNLNDLTKITRLLIDSTNATQRAYSQWARINKSEPDYCAVASAAVKKLPDHFKQFKTYRPVAKTSLFTPLLNYMATSGYFNPFTGEAQVNYQMPLVNTPVTACHEMAHQMGFAREDEANFVGFLAARQSTDHLTRYSAYYLAMQEFMRQVRRRDTAEFNQLKKQISQPVKNNLKADRLYWEHYENQISYVTSIFYDNFLKANNQPQGLLTYNRMIYLTMAYYRKYGRL
ncbi:DUF3810 domain-containing protein [Mucilaginibacter sp. CSA2-8R]|uniref:DUF3810 domain-containing protein n=1 Tax=Mucilaginibacter sp. CSA2-8R TaxID=3141542 RepID=UPI00315CBE73